MRGLPLPLPRLGVPVAIVVMTLSSLTLRSVSAWSAAAGGTPKIAVIGGGASGIFAAISAAERLRQRRAAAVQVVVLEATGKTLTKVAISGGGRCNVLPDTSRPVEEILHGYPRGRRELTGLMSSRFTPQQARAWFQNQGVALKTEPDGRMFPTTDDSQTVIRALLEAANRGGMVDIRKRQKVLEVRVKGNGQFTVTTQSKEENNGHGNNVQRQIQQENFDAIILATGSAPAGYQLAQSILEQTAGNTSSNGNSVLVSPVPSLFTLNTKLDLQEEGGLLYGLAGVSVPNARVSFHPENSKSTTEEIASPPRQAPKSKPPAHLQQEGPLLVTHHGVSGPAVLRLSAFGAREFHHCGYKGMLRIHWAPSWGTIDRIADQLWKCTVTHAKRQVVTGCPLTVTAVVRESSEFVSKTVAALPKRLWSAMAVGGCQLDPTTTWAQMSKKSVRRLATVIAQTELRVTGKGTFKEEFVTAGGVSLKEIDMKTMMSKSCPGFFLCGEVINVDGVTGGFNFMNCWGTGHVAGTGAVDHVLGRDSTIEPVPSPPKKAIPQ